MAELGVIASIIGIAGVGVKLSKTLYVTGERAVSADLELRRLATNVSLFSSSLKHFAEVMQANQNLYSPEFEQTANQIIRECSHVFEELTHMAFMAKQEGGSGSSSDPKKKYNLMQRVKIYFQQPKVDWLVAQLEYLKTTLSLLIQTLHLAAVTARAKEDSETISKVAAETIEQERIHIENLILARQYSVVILQQQNFGGDGTAKAENEELEVGRISPAPSEESVELSSSPKRLTESGEPTMSMVKVGRGALEFLDPDQTVPPSLYTSHNQIIDQLLGRWTLLPEMERDINERIRREVDLESQASATLVGKLQPPTKPVTEEDIEEPMTPPELNLMHGESPGNIKDSSSSLVSFTTPTSSQISQNAPLSTAPPPATSKSPVRSPPPLVTHTSYSAAQSTLGPTTSANQGIYRTVSSPEPQAMAQSHTRNLYSPQPSNASTLSPYTPQQPLGNPYAPPSQVNLYTPPSQAFDQNPLSPTTSPKAVPSGTSFREPSVLSGFSQQSSRGVPHGAHISPAISPYSSSPESDLDDGGPDRRLGLGIPWRIRIGPKYWDFLDERLVGPRTPYLPTEPMSWLYSHDYAHTEIDEKWVCEEAIVEKTYAYTQVRDDDGGAGQVWRVLSALKFSEVDALVERTIDIYRRRTAVSTGPPLRGSDNTQKTYPVPIPTVSHPTGIPPQGPPQNNYPGPQDPSARQRTDMFNVWQGTNYPQQPRALQGQGLPPPPAPPAQGQRSVSFQEGPLPAPSQQRSVSFQDVSLPLPRTESARWDYAGRSPRAGSADLMGPPGDPRNVHWPPTGVGSAAPSSIAATVGTNSTKVYPNSSAQRAYRERDGHRERSRGTRDKHDDDSDDYQSRRKAKSDKRRRRGAAAATVAKIGGLMAVLDGLDAI